MYYTIYRINFYCRSGPKLAQFEGDTEGKAQLLGNLASFECGRREILTKLQSSLSSRFADLDGDVLKASQIASFRSWPQKKNMAGMYLFHCFNGLMTFSLF